MALTGVEIFKLLPKTNCKKCGHPTCLAFAMKLAQRQASLDACPDVSEEAKKVLGEASAPPIRSITLGSGDKAVKMGEENVLFRHEKRFVNPCAFAVEVKDSMSDDEINKIVDDVLNSEIDRVGQRLRIDAIFVSNASNDAGRFEGVVKAIASKAPAVPLIIATNNPAAAETAVKAVADKKPLLYGADESNADAMANIAKTYKIPLGVTKYSSIVVLSSVEKWKNLSLFTLRQNIYTDPQVPMQVEQKVYKIGEATPESPLTITTNFSLTYFIVSGEIENSKVPTRLAVMDCEGLSVLTAWAAGKFTASKIAQFIQESGIENEIKHKELIIPGYVAILSGAIEDKLPGWKVTVGPREANGLPAFLRSKA